MKLEVYAYAAGAGDCIRIHYEGKSGCWRNIIIDSGVTQFAPVFGAICQGIYNRKERIDLVIITHHDEDHLGGLLKCMKSSKPLKIDAVLMNAPNQNARSNIILSARQNSELYCLLRAHKIKVYPAIAGGHCELDGLDLKILAPDKKEVYPGCGWQLSVVNRVCGHRDYHLDLAELMNRALPQQDRSRSNRSSIVCVMEYGGKKLLLTGDAWGETLKRCLPGIIYFDLVKMPHHGSASNVGSGWLRQIKCEHFLITADGRQHPDKQTIAMLLKRFRNIEVISPIPWWEKGFLSASDRGYLDRGELKLRSANGLVMSWE